MKNGLKHSVSLLMVLILLVSTLQFSLYKMECLFSGNTQISLSDFDDCNESNKEKGAISQKCCDFYAVAFDFEFDTDISLKQFSFFNSSTLISVIDSELLRPNFSNSTFNFYTNLPPPSGFELLKVVQVFRL